MVSRSNECVDVFTGWEERFNYSLDELPGRLFNRLRIGEIGAGGRLPPGHGSDSSAHEVGLGKVNHFVAAAIQHRSNHVEAEAPRLIKTDRRWH
jgi:hypothetical protein